MAKERIDTALTVKGLAPSREKARILVMAGVVFVNGERVISPDKRFDETAVIEVRSNLIPYVSYGGVKLKSALDALDLHISGKTALDVGSSTGGFTDCLLQEGAALVYAVDAGTHQLHEKLRSDKRIILRENCNARYLAFDVVGEKVDIITIDVSFISLKKILPAAVPFLKPDGFILSLVKPQFEVGRYNVGKGGIVKDRQRITEVLEDIQAFGETIGLEPLNVFETPREKEKKNREFFILWAMQKNRNP